LLAANRIVAAPEFSKICPGPFWDVNGFVALKPSGLEAEGSVGRYMLTSRRLVSSTVLRRGNASSFLNLSVAVFESPWAKGCGTVTAVSELRLANGKPLKPSEVGDAVKGGRCEVLARYEAMPYVPPWVSKLRLAWALLLLDDERDCAKPGEDLAECNVGTGIEGDPAVLRGGWGIRLGSQRPKERIGHQSSISAFSIHQTHQTCTRG
jgi:hypothetical protein